MSTRRALLAAALVLAPALLVLPAAPARAHDVLRSSEPTADSVLTDPPGQVELRFDAEVAPYAPTVVVTAPSGRQVQTGGAEVGGSTVRQRLRQLTESGDYVVAYRVVSGDGHPVTGTFTFRYDPPASATPTTTPAEPVPTTSPPGAAAPDPATSVPNSGAPVRLFTTGLVAAVGLGAAVVVAVAVVVRLLLARRRGPGGPGRPPVQD